MPDISCKEAALSEDFYDFLLSTEYLQPSNAMYGYCVQRIDPVAGCAYIPFRDIPPLTMHNSYYSSVPNLYGLMEGTVSDLARTIDLQQEDYLGLDGTGVIIGIIGTGINYTSPYFQREDGSTRIVGIWDQTIQTGVPPEGIAYGTHYSEDDITRALGNEQPLDIVPSTDTNGYGTYLASAAAASAHVDPSFRGVAPAASIAAVKLKEAKSYLREYYAIRDGAVAYQENDIMLAIKYLRDLANRLSMPLCICMCLGSSSGGHNGSSFLSRYIDTSSIGRKCVICGTGNEANARHHFSGQLSMDTEYTDVEVRVNNNSTGFWMELWGMAADIYTISVISPSGEVMPRVPYRVGGTGTDYRFTFEGSSLSVDYQIINDTVGTTLTLIRMLNPANGIWTFRIYGTNLTYGTFHMWLPITDFVHGETYFLASNPEITLTDPSASMRSITVSSYDPLSNSIVLESGRGYTLLGLVKPYVAAPGAAVPGISLRDTITRRTGTCGSSALTAGACALIYQWSYVLNNVPNLTTIQLGTQLIRNAGRSPGRTYPNRAWGYGTLDLDQVFEGFRPI